MPKPKLPTPAAGEIVFRPSFIDETIVNAANRTVSNMPMGGFLLRHFDNGCSFEAMENQLTLPLIAMTQEVIDAVGFDWMRMSLFVRRIGSEHDISSLSPHVDVAQDMRVLIEGGQSRWIFDQPRVIEQYPDGLPLSAGDAVVLNNHCSQEHQLRHGVVLDTQLPHRTSYLFNFE